MDARNPNASTRLPIGHSACSAAIHRYAERAEAWTRWLGQHGPGSSSPAEHWWSRALKSRSPQGGPRETSGSDDWHGSA